MRSLIVLKILYNALIQSHYIYQCLAYCAYVSKKFRTSLQATQNKGNCYSCQLSQGLIPGSAFQRKTGLHK